MAGCWADGCGPRPAVKFLGKGRFAWDSTQRVAIRGGNWDNGANAGLFYLNLNNHRSNSNVNRGFRAALPIARRRTPTGVRPVRGKRGPSPRRAGLAGRRNITVFRRGG